MKIRFINPKYEGSLDVYPEMRGTIYSYMIEWPCFSMAIPQLIAATPPGIETAFTDNKFEEVDFDEKVDLVAISSYTYQAADAYKIGDEFRKRGVPVVMGGYHPTLMPEEAIQHADSVVIGEADEIWPQVVKDFHDKKQKRFYKVSQTPDLSKLPLPARHVFTDPYYVADSVNIVRGCSANCESCSVPLTYGNKMRYRPVQGIIDDIKNTRFEYIYFTDEFMYFRNQAQKDYYKKIFEQMIPLKKRFCMDTALLFWLNIDDDMLKTMVQAGLDMVEPCYGYELFLNMLSTKPDPRTGRSKFDDIVDRILNRFNKYGVKVDWYYNIGFDEEDKGIFDRILEFLNRHKARMAEFYPLLPHPNSPFFKRLEKEGRLLTKDWSKYNQGYVVFKPKKMSEKELLDGIFFLYKEFYKDVNKLVERDVDYIVKRGVEDIITEKIKPVKEKISIKRLLPKATKRD